MGFGLKAESTPKPQSWASNPEFVRKQAKLQRRKRVRQSRDKAMRDLGMVKVRGALGGTFWE